MQAYYKKIRSFRGPYKCHIQCHSHEEEGSTPRASQVADFIENSPKEKKFHTKVSGKI